MSKKSKDIEFSKNHFANYRTPSFYAVYDFLNDEKAKIKFIKVIERNIRQSIEYRNFIKYLKTDAKMNYCSIMSNLNSDILNKIKIEIHHVVYTLFDIVETVLNKYLKNNKAFTILSIANEVMELHYSLKIGFCPLTITSHQLIHAGSVLINPDHIFGDYTKFKEEYDVYIPDDAKLRASIFLNKISNYALVKETNRHIFTINNDLIKLDYNKSDDSSETDEDETDMDDEFCTELNDDIPPFDI